MTEEFKHPLLPNEDSAALVISNNGDIMLHIPSKNIKDPNFPAFFLTAVAARLEDEAWAKEMCEWLKQKMDRANADSETQLQAISVQLH